MIRDEKAYPCFIVDDNQLDRLAVVSFVRKYPFLSIEGIFADAQTTLDAAAKSPPDAVFLDIDMPGISGLDLRIQLEKVKACIFITAYPDYALSAIEVNALDFLVKPLDSDRFEIAMQRLNYFLDIQRKAEWYDHSLEGDSLFIKDGHRRIKIEHSDIIYLEALKDYTGIITREKKYCVLASLGNLLEDDFFRKFIRIHRSYAVPIPLIREIHSNEIIIQGRALPIGRSYKKSLDEWLNR
ncbi:MAG TPA: LytTR family DNA-binding domain-containing protein [Puia sp.]|nr:LytTR family DNA-binding domain-containing protein [Puia sp.]